MAATPPPERFDIVDYVCKCKCKDESECECGRKREFPYLVVATLFPLLPIEVAELYRNCHEPEIRQLARAQRWREIQVGGRASGRFHFSKSFFVSKMQTRSPPPYRIGRVSFLCDLGTTSTAENWCSYLEKHAVSVAFVVRHPHMSVEWLTTFCKLRNIRELRILADLENIWQHSSFVNLWLPPGLRVLKLLNQSGFSSTSFKEVVIPNTLSRLELDYPFDTPDKLPTFPSKLLTLVLRRYAPVDVGPVLANISSALTELRVYRQGKRPAAVLRLDLGRLPRLVEHNLDVVEGEVACNAWMTERGGVWSLFPDEYTQYSRLVLPPGVEKLAIQGEGEVIPEHLLDAVLEGATDLKLLTLGTCSLALCNAVVRGEPRLAEFVLFKCEYIPKASFQFAMNFTTMEISQCRLSTVPGFIRECSQLEELRLNFSLIHVEGLTGAEFPRCLKRLVLLDAHGGPSPDPMPDTDSKPRLVDFRALVNLERLNVARCRVTDWDRWRFPESLKDLAVTENPAFRVVGTLRLPPRLEKLDLNYSPVTDFWSLTLPETLKVLDVLTNPLYDPPLGYAFPDGLQELNLSRCKLTDISGVRFPLALKKLDLKYNKLGNQAEVYAFGEGIEYLDIQRCNISNLSWWRFPLSLRKLDLLENNIGDPPDEYAFAEGLEELGMHACGFIDLAKLRLPRSLKKLDLSDNFCKVLVAYGWPPTCRVVLGFRVSELVREQLCRAHPCALFVR